MVFHFAAGNATASPDAHNNVSYGAVANGTATSIAGGQGNTITSAKLVPAVHTATKTPLLVTWAQRTRRW